jgi:hypothetical protein
MIKMASTGGNQSVMWPKGVTHITDCPNDLVMATAHAQYILAASSQLMEEEHPPHWKWAFPEELNAHFERVQRKRDEKFGNKKQDDDEPAEGWVQNDYARNLR